MGKARRVIGLVKHCRFWKRGHSQYLLDQIIHFEKNQEIGYSDHNHMIASAEWLARAQDATPDGGVVGRYRLNSGWSSTYPETTGYIIPTFLALTNELNDQRYKERARRAVEFLLAVQLQSGAFPGMEIAENRDEPSPFNTGQIINGLVAWANATGDHIALDAAKRAGNWLVAIQDEDGAWRKHYYYGVVPSYSTHIACWLAQLGKHTGDSKYLDAASRNIDWALNQRDPETGWIENMGFDKDQHERRVAYTHTIAYTLWGILYTCEILKRQDGIDAVAEAAAKIARRLELSRWLPGMLDWRWRGAADYACLTGNAQMALIWFKLYDRMGGIHYVNAAIKALDLVKRAQSMDNPDPGIKGGIAGSNPVWGDYIFTALPNWAAKYFIDALIEKKRIVQGLMARPKGQWKIPKAIPQSLPEITPEAKTAHRPKVAMLTSAKSKKVAQMTEAWTRWGFKPDFVIIERDIEPPFSQRLWKAIEDKGVWALFTRALGRKQAPAAGRIEPTVTAQPKPKKPYVDPATYCTARCIDHIEVDDINDDISLKNLKSLKPDIIIHAGAGIVRSELTEIPRLGVINAHMGILPYYRGMNVAEWAAFNGDPVGCTVHLIDTGIDTGPIICIKQVDVSEINDITQLRAQVDGAQIELLGEVMHYTLETGKLPPLKTQKASEGRQFFRIHTDLARLIFPSPGA